MIFVRRGPAFGAVVAVRIAGVTDATTVGGSGYAAGLYTVQGELAEVLDASSDAAGLKIEAANGTPAWPLGTYWIRATWIDSTGAPRALSPPLAITVLDGDGETHEVTLTSPSWGAAGSYSPALVQFSEPFCQCSDGGAGGGEGDTP